EMVQILRQLPEEFRREYPLDVVQVLSVASREQKRLSALAPDEQLATKYSFPSFIVKELIEDYGQSDAEAMLKASNEESATALRVNTLLGESREALSKELGNEGCQVT